jgi:hypothetical protein
MFFPLKPLPAGKLQAENQMQTKKRKRNIFILFTPQRVCNNLHRNAENKYKP